MWYIKKEPVLNYIHKENDCGLFEGISPNQLPLMIFLLKDGKNGLLHIQPYRSLPFLYIDVRSLKIICKVVKHFIVLSLDDKCLIVSRELGQQLFAFMLLKKKKNLYCEK